MREMEAGEGKKQGGRDLIDGCWSKMWRAGLEWRGKSAKQTPGGKKPDEGRKRRKVRRGGRQQQGRKRERKPLSKPSLGPLARLNRGGISQAWMTV